MCRTNGHRLGSSKGDGVLRESAIALIAHWNGEAAAALGTCVMRMVYTERLDIAGVPEWDLFVTRMIQRSVHHREYIGPH